MCDRARQSCPAFPGARTLHWDLPDPAEVQPDEEALRAFRALRDELERRVRELLDSLKAG